MHELVQALSSLRRRFIAPGRFLPVFGAALCFVLVVVSSAHAVQPDEIMSDPAQESRAMLQLDAVQTLAFAGLALFLGYALCRVVPVLARYNLPPPPFACPLKLLVYRHR